MPETPEQIQRQIEDTRAELAATVEQIADRVSPKKVAVRGAAVARAKVDEVFGKDVPALGGGEHGARRAVRWERVGAVGAGLLVLLLARRANARRLAAAPRKAALKAAVVAAERARKAQAKQQARGSAAPTGRRGRQADRTRAELEAAAADLHDVLARQPTGH